MMVNFGLSGTFRLLFWLLNWPNLVKTAAFQVLFRLLEPCLRAQKAIYLVATDIKAKCGFLVTLR